MSLRDSIFDNSLTFSVDRLRKELDRWMDAALDRSERALGTLAASADTHAPRVDVFESQEQVIVRLNLPGVEPAAIDMTLVGNMLTVSAPIAISDLPTDGCETHRNERPQGRYHRSIPLPAPVDADSVTAESRNGVVEVRMNKPPQEQGRAIPITVDRGTAQPTPETPAPAATEESAAPA